MGKDDICIRNINNITLGISKTSGETILFTKEFIEKNNLPLKLEIPQITECIINKKEFLPLSIRWELTSRCNLNCPFCYIHNCITSTDYTFDEAKNIIDCLLKMGVLFVTLTGGECMLNDDFSKIYKYLRDNGVLVKIFSNGIILPSPIMYLLKNQKPRRVEISLYNSILVEPRPFENILKLKNSGINVLAKLTITNENLYFYEEVSDWCVKNNIPFKFDYNILPTYQKKNQSFFNLSNKQKAKFFLMRNKSKKKREKFECFDCNGGSYSFLITADRYVQACGRLLKPRESIDLGIDVAIKKINDFVIFYKGRKLLLCNLCAAKPICNVCFADLNDSYQVPSEFCKNKLNFYKEICKLQLERDTNIPK